MKKGEKETRVIRFEYQEVRDSDPDAPALRELRGYAAIFDVLSEDLGGFREKVAPGAFARSVKQNDIRALWEHNPQYVLGRNMNGTLHVVEDQRGLLMIVNPPDTTWAADLMESVKRNDVNQMSFGFYVVNDRWDKDPNSGQQIRTLLEVDLHEVSIVGFPAYPQTSVSALRMAERLSQAAAAEDSKALLRARQRNRELDIASKR